MKLIIAILAAFLLVNTAGCTAKQNLKQADINDRIAEDLYDAAQDIDELLERYDAGLIEESQLADLVRNLLPESQSAWFNKVLAVVSDVREAAELLRTELPNVADNLQVEARELRRLAESEANSAERTWGAIQSLVASISPPAALVTTILAGFFRKKQKDAEGHTEEVVAAIHASPTVRAAIETPAGGAEVRAAMNTGTQKVVRRIKTSI